MLGESPGATGGPFLVDLNTVGDTFVPVPFNAYIPRRITLYGPSTNLGASAARLGVYSAAAGAGTEIVAPDALTTLSATTSTSDPTVSAIGNYLIPQPYTVGGNTRYGLFIRVTVAHGSAATVKVLCELEAITL